jgi:hypothetical protein
MRRRIANLAVALGVVLAQPAAARAAAPPGDSDSEEPSRTALNAYLAQIPGAESGRVSAITENPVAEVLPSYHFYAVHFRGYPIKAPSPLRDNNLFLVSPDGQVKRLADVQALESLFRSALPPVKDDPHAKTAVQAWLRLVQEMYQDGYVQFAIPLESLAVTSDSGKRTASGKARVTQGGKGEITSTLTFNAEGKLSQQKTTADVRPAGERPVSPRPR